MCTTAGPLNTFKCHPFFNIQSPMSSTFLDVLQALNVTTKVGGELSVYNLGIDMVIVLVMWHTQVTMSWQDCR